MAELRALCAELGWRDVETYIQSGNVVFSAAGKPDAIERQLEDAIAARFGLAVPVIIRTAAQWAHYPPGNPFPRAAKDEPNRLMLLVSKRSPQKSAEDAIQARAAAGEAVKRVGDALWVHFPAGSGTSKLTPSLIDRAIGSPTTSRNHRTVIKLKELLEK